MALLDYVLQLEGLSLASAVDDAGLFILQVYIIDHDQVPGVVSWPKQLCPPVLELLIDVLVGEQAPIGLQSQGTFTLAHTAQCDTQPWCW